MVNLNDFVGTEVGMSGVTMISSNGQPCFSKSGFEACGIDVSEQAPGTGLSQRQDAGLSSLVLGNNHKPQTPSGP